MANAKVLKDVFLYNLALFLAKEIIILKKLADPMDLSALWGIMVCLASLVNYYGNKAA